MRGVPYRGSNVGIRKGHGTFISYKDLARRKTLLFKPRYSVRNKVAMKEKDSVLFLCHDVPWSSCEMRSDYVCTLKIKRCVSKRNDNSQLERKDRPAHHIYKLWSSHCSEQQSIQHGTGEHKKTRKTSQQFSLNWLRLHHF